MNMAPLYIFCSVVCLAIALIFLVFGLFVRESSERFYLLTMGSMTIVVGLAFTQYKYIPPLATTIGFIVVVLIAVLRKINHEQTSDGRSEENNGG